MSDWELGQWNVSWRAESQLAMQAGMLIAERLRTAEEEANIGTIQEATQDVVFLMPTATGLQKSIMDAIAPFRDFVARAGIHDYSAQGQGPEHAVRLPARIATAGGLEDSTVSLYRPMTKQGDPRVWFSRLGSFAAPDDLLTIFVHRGVLHVVNVSSGPLSASTRALLAQVRSEGQRDALELLEAIKALVARGPIRADGHGDTAVGRTLETALAIQINSSKLPDWRGVVEIKSSRSGRGNRKNLFAQVPDWAKSGCKSSAEILEWFGYGRPGVDRKLYNTISATRFNSQGLMLAVDPGGADYLLEVSDKPEMPLVAVWPLASLRRSLRQKHRETFWVEAESTFDARGLEYFEYRRIEHTRAPVVAELEPLIMSGHITLDHLIKREESGKVVEKGPLFKIDEVGRARLFPAPRHYEL